MEIYGNFRNVYYRDEITGYSTFTIAKQDGERILCKGKIAPLPQGFPLSLSGEYYGKYLMVSDFKPADKEVAVIVSFLRNFKNIRQKAAEEIATIADGDIFSFVEKETAKEELTKIKYVSADIADDLISQVKQYKNQALLVREIIKHGGSITMVHNIYSQYGNDSIKKIKSNPYILLFADVPYATCEALAKTANIQAYDKCRMNAIVFYAMLQNNNSGNTCITFSELENKIHQIENKANVGYHSDMIFILEALCSDNYVIENKKIFRKIDYDNEMSIANDIYRLSQPKEITITESDIMNIENRFHIQYAKEQREAFHVLESPGVKIITGGPGTGKTTLLKGIIEMYFQKHPEKDQKDLALCAPTGRAAKRMSEQSQYQALTIHKLLDICPYGDFIKSKDEYDSLDVSLLIIDETSMLDTQMASILLRAVKTGTLVILLGDCDQLPSIGQGNILFDLIHSGVIPYYQLTEVFRQGKDSGIIQNSILIRNGINTLESYDDFEIHRFQNENALRDAVIEKVKILQSQHADYNVYTTSRIQRYSTGCIQMNKFIQSLLHPIDQNKNTITTNGYTFAVGDKVILTKNNYRRKYCNGDIGEVIGIEKKIFGASLIVDIGAEENITVEKEGLKEIELGYCLTTHKSQGSENDIAIVILPKNPSILLIRQLLYVAITRAKKKTILYIEEDADKIAINNNKTIHRNTDLVVKIKNNFERKYQGEIIYG